MSSRTIDVIENDLDQEEKLMHIHKTNSKYDDAEKSRLKIEALEKEHEERVLFDMHQRHKKEHYDLVKSNDNAMAAFNDYWNKTEEDINNEEKKLET